MFNKKGFVYSWSEVFKGLVIGIILGAGLVLLMMLKVIPIGVCGLCK
jgi:hypothetical protein